MVFIPRRDEEQRREPVEIAEDLPIREASHGVHLDGGPLSSACNGARHVQRGSWNGVARQDEMRRQRELRADVVRDVFQPGDTIRSEVVGRRPDFIGKCELGHDAIQVVLRFHQSCFQFGAGRMGSSIADVGSRFVQVAEQPDDGVVLADTITQ